MFGFFKKKPRFSEAQRKAAPLVVQMAGLTVGLHLVGLSKTEAALKLLHNKPVLGYIFGFHDGVMQDFRTEPRDEEFEIAVCQLSYDALFGDDGGGSMILGRSVALQDDPEFAEGQRMGGGEAVRWRRDGTVPLGLFKMMGTAD